ncbi:MAG: hypothetical protein ACLFV7_11215 [Phycisphaerae bacterium]
MGEGKRRLRLLVSDLRRLIAPLDILYQVGNLIYRRSLRYTALTVGISLLGLAANLFGIRGFTVKQALLLPLLTGAATLLLGILLKLIPAIISARLQTVAQASGLNLMEDYRKSLVDDHLRILWNRVYRWECRVRLLSGATVYDGCKLAPGEHIEDAVSRARQRFLKKARDALARPTPQLRQVYQAGLDLKYLEDWRDGAVLDCSDTKLIEQFEGDPRLVAVQNDTCMSGTWYKVRTAPRRVSQQFWFGFATRSLASRVARAIVELNDTYDTDLFNAQVLLWPGEEQQPALERFPDAPEVIRRKRREAIHRIFGHDWDSARRMLDRMLYGQFARAAELRMRYDVAYALGELESNPVDDLRAEERGEAEVARAQSFVQLAHDRSEALLELLRTTRPGLLEPENALSLRVVRLVCHADIGGMGKTIDRIAAGAIDHQVGASHVAVMIDQALEMQEVFTLRLGSLRLHHELTRLSYRDYRNLLKKLAYEQEVLEE